MGLCAALRRILKELSPDLSIPEHAELPSANHGSGGDSAHIVPVVAARKMEEHGLPPNLITRPEKGRRGGNRHSAEMRRTE